jgi:hypothetical protein
MYLLMGEISILVLIGAGIWYWWDTQQCNELALQSSRRRCEQARLQLLDATVARQRIWLRRTEKGNIQICRLYSFEYSVGDTAEFGDRAMGYLVILGRQVVETHLSHENPVTFH